jgi:hypothetical protein
MGKTLILWTHNKWIPYAGIYADVKRIQDFEKVIHALCSSEAREKYSRIIVSSFNKMQLSFGLKATGELLQKLHELKVKYDYTVIVLPHSNEIERYLKK